MSAGVSSHQWLYLVSRLGLSALALTVAWITTVYTRAASRVSGQARIGYVGAALLALAALLSAFDGIDNVVLRANEPILTSSWLWFCVFDLVLPIYVYLLVQALRERDRLTAALREQSVTDPLTGALNRRGFLERAQAALAEARRAGRGATLVVIDADGFKQVNDTQGHAAGDALLRAAVAAARTGLREGDLLGRLGGDEFAILMLSREAPVPQAAIARVLGRMRQSAGGEAATASFSAGAAVIAATESGTSEAIEQALHAADSALYEAKQGGRGEIVIAADRV